MSTEQMLKSALWYRNKKDYSVIPVGDDKRPLIKWLQYQNEKPSIEQIQEWWGSKFEGANIGIVTGKISNLTVVDIDSQAGLQAIEEITPENMITPIANSPSGGEHRYFQYEDGIGNAVRFLSDCDIRSEGGYIIAPPSQNGRGKYSWQISIANTQIASFPEAYKYALNKATVDYSNIVYSRGEGFKGLQRASYIYQKIIKLKTTRGIMHFFILQMLS